MSKRLTLSDWFATLSTSSSSRSCTCCRTNVSSSRSRGARSSKFTTVHLRRLMSQICREIVTYSSLNRLTLSYSSTAKTPLIGDCSWDCFKEIMISLKTSFLIELIKRARLKVSVLKRMGHRSSSTTRAKRVYSSLDSFHHSKSAVLQATFELYYGRFTVITNTTLYAQKLLNSYS